MASQITATDRPLTWAGERDGTIALTGVTPAGCVTVSPLTLHADTDENALLGTLATAAVTAPPLPEPGAELRQGEIYDYNGTLVMVRQDHTRTEHAPADVPALFVVWRADASEALDWVASEQVYVGTQRMYDGVLYECLQAHVTQADWTPPQVLGVLWGVVSTTAAWAAGVAYVGDNTAGAGNGDVVTYNGRSYRCLQSHTSISTWTPAAVPALWLDLGPV